MASTPQQCGAGDGLVQPGRGRYPGRTWWHSTPACQRARLEAQYQRARARRGLPGLLPKRPCVRCGDEHQPRRVDALVPGYCGRRSCQRAAQGVLSLIRARAMRQLSQEHPERLAALMREEAARLAAESRGEAA